MSSRPWAASRPCAGTVARRTTAWTSSFSSRRPSRTLTPAPGSLARRNGHERCVLPTKAPAADSGRPRRRLPVRARGLRRARHVRRGSPGRGLLPPLLRARALRLGTRRFEPGVSTTARQDAERGVHTHPRLGTREDARTPARGHRRPRCVPAGVHRARVSTSVEGLRSRESGATRPDARIRQTSPTERRVARMVAGRRCAEVREYRHARSTSWNSGAASGSRCRDFGATASPSALQGRLVSKGAKGATTSWSSPSPVPAPSTSGESR